LRKPTQATKLDPKGNQGEDADDSSDPEYDLGIVLAPVAIQGMKKHADPQATNYTYVRVGAEPRRFKRGRRHASKKERRIGLFARCAVLFYWRVRLFARHFPFLAGTSPFLLGAPG
jgi:hypothetical protein